MGWIGVAIVVLVLASEVVLSVVGVGWDPAETERSRAVVLAFFKKAHPCPERGITVETCPGWIVDHVVPLCAGGPDAVTNMVWQRSDEAAAKDVVEKQMCA